MTATVQPNIIGQPQAVMRAVARQRDLGLIVGARVIDERPDGTVEVAVTPAPARIVTQPVGLASRIPWWRVAAIAAAVVGVALVGLWVAENWAIVLGGLTVFALICAFLARVAGLTGGRCTGIHTRH